MISTKRQFNIACLQTRPRPDFKSALDEAITLAEKAVTAGADFLTLPEYCGGLKTEGSAFAPPFATEENHPVLKGLRDFAKKQEEIYSHRFNCYKRSSGQDFESELYY